MLLLLGNDWPVPAGPCPGWLVISRSGGAVMSGVACLFQVIFFKIFTLLAVFRIKGGAVTDGRLLGDPARTICC